MAVEIIPSTSASTKPGEPFRLFSEVQEEGENGPFMASIREGLKVRYGTKVAQEIAAMPPKVLLLSEAARQKFGISALVVIGEEAADLKAQSFVNQSTDKDSVLLEDLSRLDRIILLTLRKKLDIRTNDNLAYGFDMEYLVKRVSYSWVYYLNTEYKGERTISDKSMVAAIIPTHDLFDKLFHRSFTNRKVKMPAHFLWIDNQFPQAPKEPEIQAA